jgi:hypothetical protein
LWAHTGELHERRERESIIRGIEATKMGGATEYEFARSRKLQPQLGGVHKGYDSEGDDHVRFRMPRPQESDIFGTPYSEDREEDDEEVPQDDVDDMLARWTTVFGSETREPAAEKNTPDEFELDQEFLKSTALDDYFSGSESETSLLHGGD